LLVAKTLKPGPWREIRCNSVYLAMMYAETRNMTPYGDFGIANKTQNFEAVAQYQFDFGLRPSLAWVYSKGKDLDGKGMTRIWLTTSTWA
jgi:outer membrane protein N